MAIIKKVAKDFCRHFQTLDGAYNMLQVEGEISGSLHSCGEQ